MSTALRLATLLILCCLCPVARAGDFRVVALSGDRSLDPLGRVYFNRFFNPIIDNLGHVSFGNELSGVAVNSSNNNGIWSEISEGALSLRAREGLQAPGTPTGVTFSRFYDSTLNGKAGRIGFFGELDGPGVVGANDTGIWSEASTGILNLVAREGSQAPQVESGVVFSRLSEPMLNNSGMVAFSGGLSGNSNNSGIWRGRNDSDFTLVALAGSFAPGTGAGVFFRDLYNVQLGFNDIGQIAFKSQISGTGVSDTTNSGIWSEGSGNGLQLVTREGATAPGMEAGVTFRSFSDPAINNQGQTAFFSFLGGPSVNSTNERSIWKQETNGALSLVARENVLAPGTESGTAFEAFNDPVINSLGHTAFRASLKGAEVDTSNHIGIWSEEDGGQLELIAREGSSAPGTANGVNFTMLHNSPLAFNGNGQVAFYAPVTGPGVNSGNDRGIWAQDLTGNLQLIAREGDSIDVDAGPTIDMRTIFQLSFISDSGGEDGRASGFNDLGQLVYKASFTDGSQGVFVSDLVSSATEIFSADFDLDHDVDAADLLQWQGDFGLNNSSDADNDSDSDGADFLAWQRQLGNAVAAAVASPQHVPEPSTLLLATFLPLAMSTTCRTRRN